MAVAAGGGGRSLRQRGVRPVPVRAGADPPARRRPVVRGPDRRPAARLRRGHRQPERPRRARTAGRGPGGAAGHRTDRGRPVGARPREHRGGRGERGERPRLRGAAPLPDGRRLPGGRGPLAGVRRDGPPGRRPAGAGVRTPHRTGPVRLPELLPPGPPRAPAPPGRGRRHRVLCRRRRRDPGPHRLRPGGGLPLRRARRPRPGDRGGARRGPRAVARPLVPRQRHPAAGPQALRPQLDPGHRRRGRPHGGAAARAAGGHGRTAGPVRLRPADGLRLPPGVPAQHRRGLLHVRLAPPGGRAVGPDRLPRRRAEAAEPRGPGGLRVLRDRAVPATGGRRRARGGRRAVRGPPGARHPAGPAVLRGAGRPDGRRRGRGRTARRRRGRPRTRLRDADGGRADARGPAGPAGTAGGSRPGGRGVEQRPGAGGAGAGVRRRGGARTARGSAPDPVQPAGRSAGLVAARTARAPGLGRRPGPPGAHGTGRRTADPARLGGRLPGDRTGPEQAVEHGAAGRRG
ncbi:hypothetical protein EES43_16045 [Streptomyces sp. ADI96-02]|nr:hypothetical protein EES43_16045 [Streptomyces sp. ADI96-02]